MICGMLSAWLVLSAMGARQDPTASVNPTIARVVEFVQAGAYSAAVACADQESDPVKRAQALLYALHHGGDLMGALRAGMKGLDSAPHDAWLLERVAYIALSLRDPVLAERYASELRDAVQKLSRDSEGRARFELCAQQYMGQALDLRRLHEERRDALQKARGTLAVGLVVGVGAMMALALRNH